MLETFSARLNATLESLLFVSQQQQHDLSSSSSDPQGALEIVVTYRNVSHWTNQPAKELFEATFLPRVEEMTLAKTDSAASTTGTIQVILLSELVLQEIQEAVSNHSALYYFRGDGSTPTENDATMNETLVTRQQLFSLGSFQKLALWTAPWDDLYQSIWLLDPAVTATGKQQDMHLPRSVSSWTMMKNLSHACGSALDFVSVPGPTYQSLHHGWFWFQPQTLLWKSMMEHLSVGNYTHETGWYETGQSILAKDLVEDDIFQVFRANGTVDQPSLRLADTRDTQQEGGTTLQGFLFWFFYIGSASGFHNHAPFGDPLSSQRVVPLLSGGAEQLDPCLMMGPDYGRKDPGSRICKQKK